MSKGKKTVVDVQGLTTKDDEEYVYIIEVNEWTSCSGYNSYNLVCKTYETSKIRLDMIYRDYLTDMEGYFDEEEYETINEKTSDSFKLYDGEKHDFSANIVKKKVLGPVNVFDPFV